jgi:nitroimidazol reductase NimA-like FMN-containing flavoprotein (pyridoxamine 5'-phosphate oxidase superfamily)
VRRAEREVKDINEIVGVIERCDICRIAVWDGRVPYIVPLNFGYEFEGGEITLHFHCALSGRKLDIIKQNPFAGFEMDCSRELKPGKIACDYSMNYESVIGEGMIAIAAGGEEKLRSLNALMRHYDKSASAFHYDAKALALTTALRLHVSAISCKRLCKKGAADS